MDLCEICHNPADCQIILANLNDPFVSLCFSCHNRLILRTKKDE